MANSVNNDQNALDGMVLSEKVLYAKKNCCLSLSLIYSKKVVMI